MVPADSTYVSHPLEPLLEAELTAVVAIVRNDRRIPKGSRFVRISLAEPPKAEVLAGAACSRRADVVLLDRKTGTTIEATVDLDVQKVVAVLKRSDVQPPILFEEFFDAGAIVREDPRFVAALAKLAITEMANVQVDPWVTGNLGLGVEAGRRVLRGVSYWRDDPSDNGYAHPIENVVALVDLNDRKVLELIDGDVVAVSVASARYDEASVPQRSGLRPIEISQPEGPSFTLEGSKLEWLGWELRVGMHPMEGLTLHQVSYLGRSILYRASLGEMVVPYGDPGTSHAWKYAFDAGEYGMGKLTNSLTLGCDCLGEIRYLDYPAVNEDGDLEVIANAICIHEEDYGILWKHTDYMSGLTEVRRSRRLVVSAVHTVGNYEYGFFWYFYLDGTIQLEIKLTGILQTMAITPGDRPASSTRLTPDLAAPFHQHLLCLRLDMDVDGVANEVYEVEARSLPISRKNPLGNAFTARRTLLSSEKKAIRAANSSRARHWKVVNPARLNAAGDPVGYKLVPGANTATMLASPTSSVAKRAGFARHTLWVTAHEDNERHAAGDYPNQHAGGEGLPLWTEADRPLIGADVVLWYTVGITHLPRPEDWPIMPVEYAGFSLVAAGFFDQNPALDIPASHGEHGSDCAHATG